MLHHGFLRVAAASKLHASRAKFVQVKDSRYSSRSNNRFCSGDAELRQHEPDRRRGVFFPEWRDHRERSGGSIHSDLQCIPAVCAIVGRAGTGWIHPDGRCDCESLDDAGLRHIRIEYADWRVVRFDRLSHGSRKRTDRRISQPDSGIRFYPESFPGRAPDFYAVFAGDFSHWDSGPLQRASGLSDDNRSADR